MNRGWNDKMEEHEDAGASVEKSFSTSVKKMKEGNGDGCNHSAICIRMMLSNFKATKMYKTIHKY